MSLIEWMILLVPSKMEMSGGQWVARNQLQRYWFQFPSHWEIRVKWQVSTYTHTTSGRMGEGRAGKTPSYLNEAMITPVRPCSSEIWLRRQKGTKSSLPVYVTAQGQEVASRSQPPQEWEELPSLYLEEWSACSQLQDGSQPQDCGLNVVCPLQNSCWNLTAMGQHWKMGL